MKKEWTKPELIKRAYAQFENVFTYCNKGNSKQGCIPDVGWSPNDPTLAAYGGSSGS